MNETNGTLSFFGLLMKNIEDILGRLKKLLYFGCQDTKVKMKSNMEGGVEVLKVTGIPTDEDLSAIMPTDESFSKGPIAVIECFQEIPCNPCYTYCNRGAIAEMSNINERPKIDHEKCNGCGVCVSACPGLAIFVVDVNYAPNRALVKLPYEFLPIPNQGEKVIALNREGLEVGEAEVVKVQTFKKQPKTGVVWLSVERRLAMEVRNFKGRD